MSRNNIMQRDKSVHLSLCFSEYKFRTTGHNPETVRSLGNGNGLSMSQSEKTGVKNEILFNKTTDIAALVK